MEFVSIKRNKRFMLGLLCFVITFISAIFTGCDPRDGSYPFEVNPTWVCNDPYFTLSYEADIQGIEVLEWDNKIIPVEVNYQSSYYCVYPENPKHHNDRLFSGYWHYKKGNLIFVLEEDFIFDHQYSQLVFEPVDN